MKLDFLGFLGMKPRMSTKLLAPNQAQLAVNTDIRSGELRPLKANSSVAATFVVGTKQTIHLFANQYWFGWTDIVKVARGPVAGDTYERTYWTGDSADGGKPKMGYSTYSVTGAPYPTAYYRLGIPRPSSSPSLALGSGGGCDIANKVTREYAITFVSGLEEEGPPCVFVSLDAVCPGQTVNITSIPTPPAGPYNITHKNIYRSNTGSNGTAMQFVAQISAATTTYDDSLLDAQLGEVLPSENWIPPVDGLSRITELSNGMLAGFSGKDVWISEPGYPHAWPNRQTVNYDCVEICSYGTTMVVLTKGTPYIATGTDPTALTLEKVNIEQACVSARGTVRFGDSGVIYPSPDGLVMISQSGASVISENDFTQSDWQAFKPESIHAYVHDGRYVAFYNTGAATGGFIYDPSGKIGLIKIDLYATAGYVDPLTDTLYLIVSGSLVSWQTSATNLIQTWRSRVNEVQQPVNFGWARVVAKTYSSLTAEFYADGTLRHTQVVTEPNPFRLPSGFLAREWEIKVYGTDVITSAHIANSVSELKT